MRGNNYGLLMKTIKKNSQNHFSASRTGSPFSGTKFAVRLIELPITPQHDREIVMFRFCFPLFIKLCMILCVIFKTEWYLRAAFWVFPYPYPPPSPWGVFLHAMFMFDWKQPVQRWKLREGLLKINKISLIRWNMYRGNKFHSRREVLRVKCLRKSWVRQA